ncbi:hypothetical protein GCM10007392_47360 [Saccharospirillum salsuginis]|uniref:Peptidase S54 rhomboid domain-containing protein n=1 Tax=Saccharospirillum salsuginis TaxID=418750 RepID=A0A918KUQ4_9GAMM|nr:hypothetical protein GCM10007392_47360 [Saccharospirillum salsuginis]
MLTPRLAVFTTPTVQALLIIAVITFVGAWSPINDVLEYRSEWRVAGEFWRPVTAWIAQLNPQHWLINQWGLVLMALLLPTRLEKADWLALGWVWLASSVALAFSDYSQYAGLSGLLYGWLLWSLMRSPFYAAWLRWGIIAILTVKVGHENIPGLAGEGGNYVSEWIQADVAVLSHAWGLISGWLAIGLYSLVNAVKRVQVD